MKEVRIKMKPCPGRLIFAAMSLAGSLATISHAQKEAADPPVSRSADSQPLFSFAADGKLLCSPDKQGNRIPDFSRSGYMGGGVSLPDVPVCEVLEPGKGDADDTLRIQAAIDKVSSRAPDKSGIRGALLLKRGLYRVSGSLKIAASGVVVRGEGQKADGTTLLATGKQNRTLITVGGKTAIKEVKDSRRKITDSYVPWGVASFSIESTGGFSVGNPVIIFRPSTAEWIHDIGMDRIEISKDKDTKQWTAGGYDLRFERIVTAIQGKRITLDAAVVNAMDEKYGGGSIYRITESGRLTQVGLENLRLVSEYQKGKENEDEEHAWTGVALDHVANAWVRNISTLHFSHAVSLGGSAKFVTVQDCACLKPVSRIEGGRRYSFSLNGQFCLVQRCYTDHARHAEVTGAKVCGPNVFLDCLNENTHSDTGPHHRWAVGILWDNLKGGPFNAQDGGNWGSGHGWRGALQVFWNCETSSICVQKPPTAQNYAVGCIGKIDVGRFKDREPGIYESHGKPVKPRSLYLKQLEDRLGGQAVKNVTTEAQRTGTIYDILKKELAEK